MKRTIVLLLASSALLNVWYHYHRIIEFSPTYEMVGLFQEESTIYIGEPPKLVITDYEILAHKDKKTAFELRCFLVEKNADGSLIMQPNYMVPDCLKPEVRP